MNNAIKQYRPAFFDGFENETVEFDSIEQLLNISWIKNFSSIQDFYQFSISDNALMAEYRNGREWHVVGLLKNSDIQLPKWDGGIYEILRDGKPAEIPGHLVAWSCGDDVGLKDGTVLRRNESTPQ